MQVGGYWRPLAAVARLLEELGELAESLASPASADGELASELADLWIITTALVDQFLGDALEPGSHLPRTAATSCPLGDLLAAAGQIARIVNYYDGPKTPRSLERWPSLNDTVVEFQRALAAIARAHDVDLAAAVTDKLDAIPARDAGRFVRREQDPSTASSLERFRLIQATVVGLQPRRARLWGASAESAACLVSSVEALAPAFLSFSRAARTERLDAFVIAGPPFGSIESLSEWFERLVRELLLRDPRREERVRDHAGDAGRRLTFDGVPIFAEVLSPLHARGHPRHSPTGTFAVLRLDGEQEGSSSGRG
jgi:NTP pyrophosphatase (non-canonical NTP hydrolase)